MSETFAPLDLARRLVVGLAGPQLARREAAWLERFRPAGVILFARNVIGLDSVRALCAALRGCLPRGAEIMADHEGGPVSALSAAIGRPPAARSLGIVDDPELTRRVHAVTAGRLRAAGIDRVLAPCADVLVELRDPIIGVRAFGDCAETVSRHVAAAVHGLRSEGMHVCLKHWPGHGGSANDSHAGPAVAGKGAITAPFLAGLAAGADAVMVGHLTGGPTAAPGGAPGTPATLDRDVVESLRAVAMAAAWRDVAAAEPPAAPLVFADDVTMGALRPAMAARGIFPGGPGDDKDSLPVAEDSTAAGAAATRLGLVDPARLPLSWLAALAAAGHDRLLCRGIPWRALPLDHEVAETARSPVPARLAARGGTPTRALARRPVCESMGTPAVYDEAWRRLGCASGGDPFPPAAARLLWLDGTQGDRWGEAASRMSALLTPRFAAVAYVPLGDAVAYLGRVTPASERFAAVLVTAHRPQRELRAALSAAASAIAESGGCLALGHPSLAVDVRAGLPAVWKLSWLPETEAAAVMAALS